jgi:hypothetical protein
MPDLALDLRFLRYAILVAEHGSFRRAADASASYGRLHLALNTFAKLSAA